MKKRFTLAALAAACCLVSNAAVTSIDDVVGSYTAEASGWEGISDYTQWTAFSTGHDVKITKNESGTVNISNLLGFSQTLEATVDVEAKTVTIAPQKYYWYYTLADSTDVTKSVVGTIADNGDIKFTNFNVWYSGYTYFYTGAEVTLVKDLPGTEEWTVTGTLTYTDDSKEGTAYHTATTTLTKYTGATKYDYSLKFDGAEASPADLKIKVYNDGDSVAVANGSQTAGYNGGYFYSAYDGDYCIWLEGGAEGTSFKGTKDAGSLTLLCYDYATSTSSSYTTGKLNFVWDASAGVKSIGASKADDANAPVYDLMGRRVLAPTTGVYIKNGKKFVVK